MQQRASSWFLVAWLCVLALAPVQSAHAGGGWVVVLKNSPAEEFNDEDIEQFLQNAIKVLNAETPPGEVAWSNVASGSGGHFKELARSVDKAGRPCRRLRLGVYSKQKAETFSTWMICRAEDGRWRAAHVLAAGESREGGSKP
jgi:hypothetical protein